MFEQPNQESVTASQNAPQFGYTATQMFGNLDFTITSTQPSWSKIQTSFPTLQYISVYDELFFQNISNPNTSPTMTTSGSNTGEQVTAGQTVQQDAAGTSRVSTGTITG